MKDFPAIDRKWQKYWAENKTFKAHNHSDKPKMYVLDMFPYPSGAGLHVGHPLGYIASDIYARYKRHLGYNVLHPMGYDSFGLPAEQYAVQTGQHPAITTEQNIRRYREQMDRIGLSFDWDREIRTSDPQYYKWTQWIFLQLFKHWYNKKTDKAEPIEKLIEIFEREGNANVHAHADDNTPVFSAEQWHRMTEKEKNEILLKYRLTYLADTEVNWCPALGTVLANDEVVNGVSERGGHPVYKKKMRQWVMRITAYAERLHKDLDLLQWSDSLKEIQRNWIGRSEGAMIKFPLKDFDAQIEVFTTRPDTLFGVTFMVLAPEHPLVEKITTAEHQDQVEKYVEAARRKSELERMADTKEKTGVFTGAYVLHPFTGKEIPVWISDYVLAGYGTGAIMAVPAGDQRDWEFARAMNIPIINIFEGTDIEKAANENKDAVLINSDFLNGLQAKEAIPRMIAELEKRGLGKRKVQYKLRDAVFSRQRYWGEPFPIYYKDGIPYPIPEKYLPLELPEVEEYKPTPDGRPPLANARIWAWDEANEKLVDKALIDHKTVFPLELNTMPGWAGSSWYFNRYMDPQNDKEPFSQEAVNYWRKADLYFGGSEHATGHLIYSRFWQKFLYDIGLVPEPEYSVKLINQGMILGTSAFAHRIDGTNRFVSAGLKDNYKTHPVHVDVNMVDEHNALDIEAFRNWRDDLKNAEFITEDDGKFYVTREVEKMSKSKFNVVNPDDIVEQYGADTLRLYEMFLGPIQMAKPWNTAGLKGVYNFIKKFRKLYYDDRGHFRLTDREPDADELRILHTTIRKVRTDIENFDYNTAISAMMIAVNELSSRKTDKRAILEPLIVLIAPFAPHLAEELWQQAGHEPSVCNAPYPEWDEQYLQSATKEYPVSFNGKMRFKITLPADASKDEIEQAVLAHERTAKYLDGKKPRKIIVVPGRIVNIVV